MVASLETLANDKNQLHSEQHNITDNYYIFHAQA